MYIMQLTAGMSTLASTALRQNNYALAPFILIIFLQKLQITNYSPVINYDRWYHSTPQYLPPSIPCLQANARCPSTPYQILTSSLVLINGPSSAIHMHFQLIFLPYFLNYVLSDTRTHTILAHGHHYRTTLCNIPTPGTYSQPSSKNPTWVKHTHIPSMKDYPHLITKLPILCMWIWI